MKIITRQLFIDNRFRTRPVPAIIGERLIVTTATDREGRQRIINDNRDRGPAPIKTIITAERLALYTRLDAKIYRFDAEEQHIMSPAVSEKRGFPLSK